MTRDEVRAKCIETMAMADCHFQGEYWDELNGTLRDCYRKAARPLFNALHGVAFVTPLEATEDMLAVAANYFSDPLTAYEKIAAAGDLTNPPEKKS